MSEQKGEYSKITWDDVTVKIGTLKPWDGNPKTSTKKDARALLKSWDELGQFQTIAIGPGGDVYDGHQRLSALLLVHGPEYQIAARQSSRPLTDEERRKIAIYSRQIGAWDWDILSSWQPAELMEWGFDGDLLKDWKRDTAALDNFLKSEQAEPTDAEPQVDRAAELNEKWQVQPGDMWQIGPHRLLCGDSTKREDVERVMGGERADMIETDPPYGVDYTGASETMFYEGKKYSPSEAIKSDATPEQMEIVIHDALSILKSPITFVWCAPQFHEIAKRIVTEIGYKVFSVIVWNKNHANFLTMGARYKPKYEMALACKIDKIPWYGPDNETTVWDVNTNAHNNGHPTQKPVELFERAIRNHTETGAIVYEPFAGSGTTLVACQNLGRVCRAIEISPNYCAVILERMATAFPSLPISKLD